MRNRRRRRDERRDGRAVRELCVDQLVDPSQSRVDACRGRDDPVVAAITIADAMRPLVTRPARL